ncbi:MAG: GAF and ANTAR domain-containing protein [Actinomycetota bacterium]|nr:GAF and ANTAR domain-containing protein [Actinomycetota bacterium]MDQ3527729.1 GAF and ANTAR domain-containing protein [Actinomycetota bacterium]
METLARAMADFAEEMQMTRGLAQIATVAAETASRLIPGVEQASVSLARRGVGIDTLAADAQLPWAVDAVQVATGQGPCIQAAWQDRVALLQDTATEESWPEFCRQARQLGVGSMLSLQLSLDEADDQGIGAINTYARTPHAFTQQSVDVGMILAVHASVGVTRAQQDAQLRQALASRDLIGQAKGMLMAQHGMSADTAFDVLVRQSRDTNTRLRDVAASIVMGAEDREAVSPN